MKSDFLIISIIILVILISGCTQTGYVVNHNENATNMTNETTTTIQESTTSAIAATVQEKHCPETCNDNNSCTEKKCSSETNYECTYKAITPCCGNSVCEENETCLEDCPLINVSITNINYENPEWVEIKNYGNAVNLTGWTLEDLANHKYTFQKFTLSSGLSVKLHTESGSNNQTDLYWGYNTSIWNNDGDNATLKDSKGNIIDEYSYPKKETDNKASGSITTTSLTTSTTTTTTTPTTTTATSTSTTMPTTTTTSSTTTSSTTTTTETSTTTTTTIQESTTTTTTSTTTTIPINHLLISEVYYDSVYPNNRGEWIELYNPTTNDINLSDYIIGEPHRNWTLLDVTIVSSDYIIITKNATYFYELYPYCHPVIIEGMTLVLANNGDNLTLKNATNETVDFVSWGNSTPGWNIFADKNMSIIRKYGIDTNTADDWLNNQTATPHCA